MDMRRRQIAKAGFPEGADSGPSLLSGSKRALSYQVEPCRTPAMAARTVRLRWDSNPSTESDSVMTGWAVGCPGAGVAVNWVNVPGRGSVPFSVPFGGV